MARTMHKLRVVRVHNTEFERSIEMRANISKWNALAATLLYASAVFQIADNHFGLGAVFFVAASSFAVAARINKKTEPENEKQ